MNSVFRPKGLLLAVVCSLFLSHQSSAQLVFPNYHAEWHVGSYWQEAAETPPYWYTHSKTYAMQRSELIDSVLEVDWNGGSPDAYLFVDDFKVYASFLSDERPFRSRQDLENDQYYLLYDFEMEVGDTAYMTNSGTGWDYPVTVDQIVVIPANGNWLKQFELSNGDVIIERIGSMRGLFSPFVSHFEVAHKLCEYHGAMTFLDMEVYIDAVQNNCLPQNEWGLSENQKLQLLVYPNPSTDQLKIEWPSSQVARYAFLDLTGKEIVTGDLIVQGSTILDVSNIAAGTYLLKVFTDDEPFGERLVHVGH